jgi:opacity protein-like surface antigen
MDQIMKNKFFLLSALLGMTLTSAASADEGFYISVLGGPDWVNQLDHRQLKVDFKTGYFVGGSVGYQWCNNISVEAEFTYRHNQLDKIRFRRDKCKIAGSETWTNFRRDRDLESFAAMANVRYDWAIDCMCFVPYIRAGLGYANTRHSVRFDRTDNCGAVFHCRNRHNKSSFAWQAGAGITIPDILCNTHLDIGYNYFSTTQNGGSRGKGLGHNELVVAAKYVF